MQNSLFLVVFFGCLMAEVVCQTGLTEEDKQVILDTHNKLRGMVSPTAANMERMEWSDELAEIAQNHANRCIFAHNSNSQSQQETFRFVGENLAANTAAADYAGFVQNWYNEVDDYDYNTLTCSGVSCGHYTQIVWATSRYIGCGVLRCANLQNAFPNGLLFVCHYGPAGNFRGQRPYLSGPSCSACPADLPNCVENACTSSTSPTASPQSIPLTNPTAPQSTRPTVPSGTTTQSSIRKRIRFFTRAKLIRFLMRRRLFSSLNWQG